MTRKFLLLLWPALMASVTLLSACPGPDWPKCENDDHCKADRKGNSAGVDLICVFGQCQECAKDTDCKDGKVCRSYACVVKPECEADSDCSDNKVCKAGQCKIECNADVECGSGSACKNNRCKALQSCAEDSDCGEGEHCKAGYCSNDGGDDGSTAANDSCELVPRIQFPFNEASITAEARQALDQNADCLRKQADLRITIEGHCDERGTAEYNLALGERRANAARKYLQRLGVDVSRVKILSYGEERPLSTASDEAAWAANRRDEFKTR